MLPHPLTNFEMQKYYQNEPKFSVVYSRNTLPKIKDGSWAINHDDFKSIGFHWIALYVNGNIDEYLTMQYISIVSELNVFQKKFKKS